MRSTRSPRHTSLRRLRTTFSISTPPTRSPSSSIVSIPPPTSLSTALNHANSSASSTSTTPLSASASKRRERDSYAFSDTSDDSFSPLSNSYSTSPSSHFSHFSTTHSAKRASVRLHQMLLLRRKPSLMEIEIEDERRTFGQEMAVLEPRPLPVVEYGGAVGGIFEVLDGKV
ncbi:hypothetical protein LTS18_004597 [Coniosporium uncinatum]|uniref:Uncharacterized protein n=1 Tax=Coniosporium uncinatum TaxID=93489 RepID=A0ACC3DS02_9PEZI|nr:hypothetical protein LTS18_004597 [Coniosporium uncinatum]